MKRFVIFFCISIGTWLFPSRPSQEPPRVHQEVAVQWRVVPVYAFNRQGGAVADLTGTDIEVYLDRRRIDSFLLVRKESRLDDADKEAAAGKDAAFLPRRKLIFLVFDNALTPGNLMKRAKKIAEAMLDRPGDTSQYIVMAIEPFGGLTHVIGPDASREEAARAIRRRISGKKSEFQGSRSFGADIRDTMPSRTIFGYENPSASTDRFQGEAQIIDKSESMDNRRITSAFQSSLEPLTAILGAFQESAKVVYLFSSGIPSKVFGQKKEYQIEDSKLENTRPDVFHYKGIQTLASVFRRNGVPLFLVNPGGTRIKADDPESGEKSLQMIADDSGGRYYSGTEKEITSEVLSMERAYYEIFFPDSSEAKNPEIDFEIVSRRPDITIYSARRLARAKAYSEMSRMEREVLILDATRSGYLSRVKLKITPFALGDSTGAGGLEGGRAPIPDHLLGNDWDLYRVWIEEKGGDVKMEQERIVPRTAEVVVEMKTRRGYRRYAVLVHPGTGTALVGGE